MGNNITIYKNKSVKRLESERVKIAASLSLEIDKEKRKSQIENIDYIKERERFFKMHESNSKQTARTYKNAIKILEEYAALYNINILDVASNEADDFVIALKNNKELSSNSVRLIVAGCSSLFTYLERSFTFIKNPFRGTKTRPKNTNKKNTLIPTKKEIDFIVSNIKDKTLRAVIIFIKETGVRIGSLKSLEIKISNKKYIYKAHSKGHDVKGIVSTLAMSAIKKSGLDNTKPFEKLNTEAVRVTIYKNIKSMHTKKLINSAYSVHDFRHYFAVENYKTYKDIYKLKNLLCHSSIAITERYLKSMDIDIGE